VEFISRVVRLHKPHVRAAISRVALRLVDSRLSSQPLAKQNSLYAVCYSNKFA
jgi:hypothetical protein